MNVTSLNGAGSALPISPEDKQDLLQAAKASPGDKTKLAEASRQFEGVMVRQFLSESMKSLTNNGESGQVYGYFLNDTISDCITKGGGLGLASVFQAQIGGQKGVQ